MNNITLQELPQLLKENSEKIIKVENHDDYFIVICKSHLNSTCVREFKIYKHVDVTMVDVCSGKMHIDTDYDKLSPHEAERMVQLLEKFVENNDKKKHQSPRICKNCKHYVDMTKYGYENGFCKLEPIIYPLPLNNEKSIEFLMVNGNRPACEQFEYRNEDQLNS